VVFTEQPVGKEIEERERERDAEETRSFASRVLVLDDDKTVVVLLFFCYWWRISELLSRAATREETPLARVARREERDATISKRPVAGFVFRRHETSRTVR
jgi:hypothetical protein